MNLIQKMRWNIAKAIAGKAKLPTIGRRLPMVGDMFTDQPIWTDWSTGRAIKEGLKASVWVYASIKAIMDAASSVPLITQELNADGEWEKIDHPITTLLRYANPITTGKTMSKLTTNYLNLGGNCLYHLIKVSNQPVEMWPLHPDLIKPIVLKDGTIAEYVYRRNGGQEYKIPAADILHIMFPDPDNPYWGLSPLQSAAKAVDTDIEAATWNKVALNNRAVTDGAFVHEATMSLDQWADAKEMVEQQHKGSKDARKPWVLGAGAKWVPMSLSPVDMDFIEGRKFGMYEIHATFGVDPLVTGAPDTAGRANKQEARLSLWEDTVIPYLDTLVDSYSLGLVPFWQPESLRYDVEPTLRVFYDLSGVAALKKMINEKAKTALIFSRMGVPFNVIDKKLELGFGDIEGGDVPIIMSGAAETATEGDVSKEMAALPRYVKKKAYKASSSLSEEQKLAIWTKVDSQRLKWEKRFRKEVDTLFNAEGAKVASAYESGGTAAATAAITANKKSWESVYDAGYTAIIEFFGKQSFEELSEIKSGRKAEEFDETAKRVRAWIKKNSGKRIVGVSNTSKDTINTIILSGSDAGLNSASIGRNIRNQYKRWSSTDPSVISTSRAMTIARTETTSASGFGGMEGAKQAGEEFDLIMTKTWISSRDGEVRELHEEIDGETRGIDDEYSNGLQYVGDPNGDAAEVIQCRCADSYEAKRRK